MKDWLFFLICAVLQMDPLGAKLWEGDPHATFQETYIESYYEVVEQELDSEPLQEIELERVEKEEIERVVASGVPLNRAYRIKIGDQLLLSVYGEDHTRRGVIVDPTGSITYLFVNGLLVIGKTVQQVREELQEKLSNYYRYPLISITPIKFAGEYYTIFGEVNQPGKKIVEGHSTVLSALCEAQGFTTRKFREQIVDQADLSRSFLSRQGNFVPVDFQKLVLDGDMSQNQPLQEGDFIFVETKQMNQVFVVGFVGAPTTIEFIYTMSLAEAIAAAGGLLYESSSRVVVIRGSLASPTTYLIDINRVLKGRACDFILEPGDIVYVPPMKFTNLKEVVQGAINAFVATSASFGGTNAFVKVVPDAGNSLILGPVPTIPTGVFIP